MILTDEIAADEIAVAKNLVNRLECGEIITIEEAVAMMYSYQEKQDSQRHEDQQPMIRELRSSIIRMLLTIINSRHEQLMMAN